LEFGRRGVEGVTKKSLEAGFLTELDSRASFFARSFSRDRGNHIPDHIERFIPCPPIKMKPTSAIVVENGASTIKVGTIGSSLEPR